jgi:outer membrane lipopolysaccharide assembly protein LptE/RlpB
MLMVACGYRIAGREKLPDEIATVGVSVLNNRTGLSGLEAVVSNALVDEFTRRRPSLVVDAQRADAVLTGSIESLTTSTVARRDTLTALERRMVITVSLVLRNKKGEILWRQRISANEIYLVYDGQSETEMSLRVAAAAVARRLGEYAYERLTDAF